MNKQNIDYITGASISPEKISWIEKYVPQIPGDAVDIGCGAGLYSTWLAQRKWRVHALDINEPPSLKNVDTRAHNLEEGLPFPDRSFDLVLAWDIMEHVIGEKRLWSDIARVLRPAGIFIGSVPHASDQRLHPYNITFKHHIDKTHQREYNPKDIEGRSQAVQLVPKAIELKGPVSPQVIAEFVSFKAMRRPVALLVGAARRIGFLNFGELHSDIFFTVEKPSALS